MRLSWFISFPGDDGAFGSEFRMRFDSEVWYVKVNLCLEFLMAERRALGPGFSFD